jgi:hypothetical protein
MLTKCDVQPWLHPWAPSLGNGKRASTVWMAMMWKHAHMLVHDVLCDWCIWAIPRWAVAHTHRANAKLHREATALLHGGLVRM